MANASSSPASPRRRSTVVERDYPNTYRRFTALGPLADKLGNGGKGIAWNTEHEVKGLGELNAACATRARQGQPRIETDIDAGEVILCSRRKPTARSRSGRGRRSAR